MKASACWLVGGLMASLCFLGAGGVHAGPAIGQFEIKDLEAEPGTVEFQSQNAHSWGLPKRQYQEVAPGEFAYDDNSVAQQRHALEIEMTLTHFFRMRVGIEYEKERLDDPEGPVFANDFGGLTLDEIAVEGVVILIPIKNKHGIGLGALTEVEHPLETGSANSVVFGPIIEAQYGPWSAVANLTLVHFFGGDPDERDPKWDFAYATQIKYDATENWAFALEAYGTVDRLGNSGTPDETRVLFGDFDQHRMGPLIYYTYRSENNAIDIDTDAEFGEEKDEGTTVTIGVGLLAGLNQNTPEATLKWSVEVEF
ncbi:conserved exported protein of unknown function [Candidatus Filomicrobium marinum]|uniref:Transporter n=2 Tax=Filomicrobium TaxID=119044 RepID=A0A0D6JKT7_9HYPH|nr:MULTISPECIES: hypothetical protein [Filomicrobium]MCV0369005.1 hypothetical protein [Filomicrobium sp.]CFX64214.1 conserved exported protein of unknown function [Candidatus Filomicrobium marinum]CPR22584.1 conserved exported protein of unknown function [Candidatus Filomicrobium marinum]SDO79278.1 hypothetical protein SAMN04488061_1670 [Filomicrobium insigne]